MRRMSLLIAVILLAAPASTCRQEAQAKIPPGEIKITVWDNRHRGMEASYKVYWGDYLLSLLLVGDHCGVHLRMDDPADPRVRHHFDLDIESNVAPLRIDRLPRSWREPIRVCTEMAAAALEKEANTTVLPAEVKDFLSRIAQRRFIVTGLPVQGEISLSWRSDYLGEGPRTTIDYNGIVSKVDITSEPEKVYVELVTHPTFQDSSPCVMQLTVTEGRLNMKILNCGWGGPPAESQAMETMRQEIGKMLGIVRLEGAEDDVLAVLEKLNDALRLSPSFSRYEVVTVETLPQR